MCFIPGGGGIGAVGSPVPASGADIAEARSSAALRRRRLSAGISSTILAGAEPRTEPTIGRKLLLGE